MLTRFDRNGSAPVTHAFVIGVGRYPHAKPDQGILPMLRNVPDLPSAADSARLMCKWLLDNKDRLAAPLASLEVLISDPDDADHRFAWGSGPFDPATEENVTRKGLGWFKRLNERSGDVAFFYCCGHGAAHLEQPTLFLEDLNKNLQNPWSHIALRPLANALRKNSNLSAAFLFSDACSQYLAEFNLAQAQECRFYLVPDGATPARNHVSLLCAAPEAQLAYEGPDAPGSEHKFGRFTLVCLKGLDGSSARWSPSGWGVMPRDLLRDLKPLRNIFFSHWGEDAPFDPYDPVTQTIESPIVYPASAELPIVVMTNPIEQMPDYGFAISQRDDPHPPWLRSRDAGNPMAWSTTVPRGRHPLYAIAVNRDRSHSQAFVPDRPLFMYPVELL